MQGHPEVLHDLDESVPYLYDNTIGDGPYNAWIDPILADEWQMIGWNNVSEMTKFGMPGVFTHGNFDTWSPGYLMFIAALHNGISRLYETFGNGGADTVQRTLSPNDYARTWYKQNPPLPKAMWSQRNNNNYEQTGLLTSLHYFAANNRLFLRNFYTKSKRSILKAKAEGPAAYVLPVDDARPGAQAELLRTRDKQEKPTPTTRTFPAGSFIVRMDQPYSRIADSLLDYQYWSPNDPQKTPYDDTGWTFPELYNVQAVRIIDAKVLVAPVEKVAGTVHAPGAVTGAGSIFIVNHNADSALATLRYTFKGASFEAAEEPV